MRIDLPSFERELDGARDMFQELGSRTEQRKVLGPALLAWARVVRDVTRKTTVFKDHSKPPILRPSIRAYRFKARGSLPPGAFVAAGPYLPRHRAFHAHLVEFGHGGPSPAPPHPFLSEGVKDAGPQARETFVRTFRDRVRIVVERLAKKHGVS